MPAAGVAATNSNEGANASPGADARGARRRSGGGRQWQEFRRANLLAKELGAVAVCMHGRSIKIFHQHPPPKAAPSPTPLQDSSNGRPSAAPAQRRSRGPAAARRSAARRQRFFGAKDHLAVEAALPAMFEEAAAIAPMVVDSTADGADARAAGPAESAVSASATIPAPLAGAPSAHATPWSKPSAQEAAQPSPGVTHACPPLQSPPSRPPAAKKFARPRG